YLSETFIGAGTGIYAVSAKQAFLDAAVPEESFKLIALLCLVGHKLRALQPNRLFTMAVATACGFATFENIFYVVEDESWGPVAIMRSLSAVPGHAFVGAVMGFCLFQAVRRASAILWWAMALILPIALHGAYDFFLFALSNLDTAPTDTPAKHAQAFVHLFAMMVVVEGVMAHLCLRSTLRKTDFHRERGAAPAAVSALQRVVGHPLLWGVMGLICLIGAVAFSWGSHLASDEAWTAAASIERSFDLALAAFAALHGTAFVGLAVVLRRRARIDEIGQPL
ncbi:MAG: PrsW family glutamic-type intramembrane protease, partial [Alphaproteobacteria bacterium]|nr:PrsW family glutamic-type intramembrane protease [Alphaproteobacteria bacterium]